MKWAFPIIFLAGCANAPTEVQTVRVEIPIRVPCVDSSDVPDRPEIDPVTRDSSPGQKIEAVVVHRQRLISHADELEALLVSCQIQ